MPPRPAAPALKPAPHSVPYNLGVLALGAGLVGLALAYGIDAAVRTAPNAGNGETVVARSLGGRELTIPISWLRAETDPTAGFAKQIDLTLTLPLGPNGAPEAIAVTLLPRSQVRPSSSLLDGVYLHQFMPEQLSGPPGLIGKPLVAEDGYADETVWYDPISSNPFVAKCIAPVSGETVSRCVRSVYLGAGVAAIYDFQIDALQGWRGFDAAIREPMGRIGAL
ncbi:MAG: hypothetical protein ABIO40_08200 [Devosia sp.]